MMRLRSSTRMCDSGPLRGCAASVIDDLRGLGRRARRNRGLPRREPGPALAPFEVREAEVEIGQAAADRDVADPEARSPESAGLRAPSGRAWPRPSRRSCRASSCVCRPAGLSRSFRQRMSRSSRPSARAWRLSAGQRSRPAGGNSRPPPARLSRYSQMTAESIRTVPSASTSVGILLNGLSSMIAAFGLPIAATLRTHSILSGEAEFVRRHHHLSHERRPWRPVQFHAYARREYRPPRAFPSRQRSYIRTFVNSNCQPGKPWRA